jgi:serpin B
MHARIDTDYANAELFEAVRLSYAGDAAMVVLLPKQNSPAELAAAFSRDDVEIAWGNYEVDLTLPSFEFEGEIGLRSALQELGMRAAFAPGEADLTGITAARELYVSDAFHKTFIALDEQGTEAAAATALIMDLAASISSPPATFTADRPFLFWIEHSSTGEMLFLGQVTNPG